MTFNFADLILPVIFLLLFIALTFKSMPAFDLFVGGAKGAVELCISVLPYIATILIAVQLLRVSGLAVLLSRAVSPAFHFFGIPTELAELTLLRPFSGGGSVAILNDIIAKYGVDSYIARSAAVMMGSSETVFYVVSVYFAACKARKLRYAIPVALLATLIGAVVSCLLCRFM